MSRRLHIVHLYPDEMNTYGDRGNILTLTRRCEWYGLEPILHYHHPGKRFPPTAHILFGGGGQDSAQSEIQHDILMIGDELHRLGEMGVPMLMICGMYQLFGRRFVTHDQKEIKGVGIFNAETRATKHRLIGNIAVETKDFGVLYGFENHSGQTFLDQEQLELGSVTRGKGNNDRDRTEGARTNNILGSYMHGPMLSLNPRVADWLILTALYETYGITELPIVIDDTYAQEARLAAKLRKY